MPGIVNVPGIRGPHDCCFYSSLEAGSDLRGWQLSNPGSDQDPFHSVSTHVKSHGSDSPTQRGSRSEGCFLPFCSQRESQKMGPNNGKSCLVPSPVAQEKNSWARVMGSLMQLDGRQSSVAKVWPGQSP